MKEMMKYIPLFEGMKDEELGILEKYFILKTCEKDEMLITPDSVTKELFIAASGKLTGTTAQTGSVERKIGRLGPGDFFGEISLFANRPAGRSIAAAEKCELLVISEEGLQSMMNNNPEIATVLISNLLGATIRQFRKTSRFLADVVQWGESASRRVITDELTGVYNREFLEDALEEFFNISRSNNKPLSLLMIDIDNYRQINDTLGHEKGSEVLIELAALIKSIISDHGIIARYGGDEFSVLLPEADLRKAAAIAERIRLAVEAFDSSRHLSGTGIAVTASVGISSFPETATDLAAFREKADSSLYRAKESGRNRVEHIE